MVFASRFISWRRKSRRRPCGPACPSVSRNWCRWLRSRSHSSATSPRSASRATSCSRRSGSGRRPSRRSATRSRRRVRWVVTRSAVRPSTRAEDFLDLVQVAPERLDEGGALLAAHGCQAVQGAGQRRLQFRPDLLDGLLGLLDRDQFPLACQHLERDLSREIHLPLEGAQQLNVLPRQGQIHLQSPGPPLQILLLDRDLEVAAGKPLLDRPLDARLQPGQSFGQTTADLQKPVVDGLDLDRDRLDPAAPLPPGRSRSCSAVDSIRWCSYGLPTYWK